MMNHEERSTIQEKLLEFAENKSGEFKYAYAFGSVWALLNDSQLKTLNDNLNEWTK